METILEGVQVAGLCAAVPASSEAVIDSSYESLSARQRFSAATGVCRRRICPPDLFFSDLAFGAARKLLDSLGWANHEVEALIVVTQSGDLSYPATACILQNRLGLETSCAAFDLNLGCSGFPYGLLVAGRMISANPGAKALLLVGDAAGKLNPAATRAPLFGDAAAAVALQQCDDVRPMQFFLNTDGSGWDFIMERRPGGKPGLDDSSFRTFCDAHGCIHIDTQYRIRGEDVFHFSVSVVPRAAEHALQAAGWARESVDAFVFHQASLLINESIRRELKLPPDKTPSTLSEFGNTSSATIPLTMAACLASQLSERRLRLLLCGFGVGLSWGTATCEVGPIICPPIVEV